MAGRLAAYMPGALDIEFALPSVEAEPVLLQCRPMSATRPARGAGPKWGSGKRITGRPCAGGVATGIVVPRGEDVPADESAIALVDTLSTHDYDLIFRHEGVIATEDISPLSHPAILCRELGVPLICATGARAARLAGRRVMLDGGSGIAEVLPAGRPVPAESLPPERALYLTDVERALMIHVDAAAGGDPAGAPPEAVLARSLGAREVRVLRVPLAESETQELASLPEQGRREPISAQ
jgi:phosphohistidine swiveling domain-containing protein